MSSEKVSTSINHVNEKESLIDFPCEFPIKVMGPATVEFNEAINNIVLTHDKKYDSDKTTKNTSKTGKYTSLTVRVFAENQSQLDAIYKDLTDNELVLWAL